MAYKMKMYDPSGKLVEVNRNQQDELLGQGYSFMGPKTTTANTQTVNYVEPEGGYPAIRGDAGGIGYSARRAFEGMINQEPGYEGGYLDGFNSVEEMQKFYGLAPEINPIDDIMAEYRDQINALATETDPGYNENLEQISPEDMEEEIL